MISSICEAIADDDNDNDDGGGGDDSRPLYTVVYSMRGPNSVIYKLCRNNITSIVVDRRNLTFVISFY